MEVSIISKTKNNLILTIVIPVYNVEKYIGQCLNSLINQNVSNFNIIVVNDGSTDDTEEICKKFLVNENVKYIYQENTGLGAARNTGLKYVDTPYVSFLDSDDWQDIRFVEKFEKLINSLDFEPDMIFTLPQCFNEASYLLEYWMDKQIYDEIFDVKDGKSNKVLNIEKCPELYSLEVNANRRIYRTQFLKENNFSFPEGVKWEDIRPHVQLLHRAKNIVALPDTGFFYRTNVSGQITAGTGVGRLDIIPVFKDVLSIMEKDSFSNAEQAQILNLICKYSFWMIDMTNVDYIQQLLEGLHEIFLSIPSEMIEAFSAYSWEDKEEQNKKEAFIYCMRSDKIYKLVQYEDRENMYRYWRTHGVQDGNVISRGIQCVKDSGIKYTIKLVMKKITRRGE